jgi:hypothetical protein
LLLFGATRQRESIDRTFVPESSKTLDSTMESLMVVLIAGMLLLGLAGATRELLAWYSLRRRSRERSDDIPLAFSTSLRSPAPRPAAPVPAQPVWLGADPSETQVVETKTVRFHQLEPGTVRLLPGRLEVEGGEEGRAEVRFVDVPGGDPRVTFGRRKGTPLHHVELRSRTVSRDHAVLVRKGASWFLANRSGTNPVVVNSVPLHDGNPRPLHDGDRIEMGEVVFRYREP